jgi:hypothetical protein
MSEQESSERRNIERIGARAFTLLGGFFWIATSFAGPLFYQKQDALHALFGQGVYPLVFTFAVLAVGWFYERFAALILSLGAVGTVAWGFINATWEPMVWGIVLAFFVAPTIISAMLYYLADNGASLRDDTKRGAGAAV